MNKVNIIAFIKNEEKLIESFIRYHQKIVNQIIIVDNGSTDNTIDIIKKFDNIQIIYDYSDFDLKGEICSNIIKQMNEDIVIPLDADEFIIYDDGFTISDDTKLVKSYLQNLLINGYKYKINNIYNKLNNDLYHTDTKILNYPKIILPIKNFISIDCGFHEGKVNTNNDLYNSINISYVHYHYYDKQYWLESSNKKLKARLKNKYNDFNEILKLANSRNKSYHVAQEYVNYLKTGEWCVLKGNKNLYLPHLDQHHS